MDTMKEIGLIIHVIVCCINVKGNIETYNWFDAQQLCQNSSKRLTTNASDSMDFIWTGRYKRFSQWIKILGCYKDSSLRGGLIIKMSDLEYPSIGLCQEHCLKRHYSNYAFKATECVCLQKDFKGIQLPWDECDRRCLNADDEILSTECGGEEAFNVFSTESGIKFTDVAKPCIALQCKKNVSRFEPFDCFNSYGIICSISDVDFEKKRWRLSFERCKSLNNTHQNQNDFFDFSKAEEACKIINITSDAPLWVGVVREIYVSEDQGESILDKTLITKCQKCKYSHCEFVTCSKKNITKVICTALSIEIPDVEPPDLDIRLIIGPATAAFIVGAGIIICLIFRRRERRHPKTNETPTTKTDYEKVQKRKISNKNKHYTKDDIRHLGHSNPSYIETTEVVKKQENPNCTKQDGDYDELHQTKSRKIERSDIFHYSLHLPPSYDTPCQEEKKDTILESGYDIAFTNRISKIELSKCHQENV